MPRKSKAQKCIEAHTDLLVILDALAALPPEACKCGLSKNHERCAKCGACKPRHGGFTYLGGFGAFAHYADACGECGVKANRYSQPLYTWWPKDRFATSFARDLAAKIRRGLTPSPKQVALAEKLSKEDHNRKPFVWERPAITWLTPNGRKAWKAAVALLARDAFEFTKETEAAIERRSYEREDEKVAKEAVALVRSTLRRIIEERTGYAVLCTVEDYADALKATAEDELLTAVLRALLDLHVWITREKRVVDGCPPHLTDLRRAIAFGDTDAAIVLADAIEETKAATEVCA